jgi:3-deoxy-7-phosphoheptulonate synthase
MLARESSDVAAHGRIADGVIRTVHEITLPAELIAEMPTSGVAAETVREARADVRGILDGGDHRLLVVIGPCSIHDVSAARRYARWLCECCQRFKEHLYIVMRVYVEKPRTQGGWKGLINDPYLDGTFRINDGLRRARQLLIDINGMGVPTATEFVHPITAEYIGDLISWAAIGARTTESQLHRELASGLSCPVGFKNSTSGDVRAAVNAVVTASRPHHFLGVTNRGTQAIVATPGNRDCHVILRGGARPNYDEVSVAETAALLTAEGASPRLMVDCSHGNCEGDYRRQLPVAEEVARQRSAGSGYICGVMVESNLLAGRQLLVAGTRVDPGMSITDACLGIDDTATLLAILAEAKAGRRGMPAAMRS